MEAELRQMIARKTAESPPSSLANGATTKATTPLDTVQLTSILSASGFHLDYFDIDRSRIGRPSVSGSDGVNAGDTNNTTNITVEITCHRSGIVSRMHHTATACTCPSEEECTRRSAIWDVQGAAPVKTGTAGGAMADGTTTEVAGASVTSSSNLLPQLTPRKVQICKHLIKVMLEVFEAKDENGNVAKFKNSNVSSKNGLTFEMESEDSLSEVVGGPKILLNGEGASFVAPTLDRNGNSEADKTAGQPLDLKNLSASTFASPNSDIYTSSPKTTPQQIRELPQIERDRFVAGLRQDLRQNRQNIDNILAMLDGLGLGAGSSSVISSGSRPRANIKVSALSLAPQTASTSASRRHSLSVLPGAVAGGASTAAAAVAAARAAAAKAGVQRRLSTGIPPSVKGQASSSMLNTSNFGATTKSKASTNVANSSTIVGTTKSKSSAAATSFAAVTPATRQRIAQHNGTPRPAITGGATAARISLVARNSAPRMPPAGTAVISAAAAAGTVAATAASTSMTLSRNNLTRSLNRSMKTPTAKTSTAAAGASVTKGGTKGVPIASSVLSATLSSEGSLASLASTASSSSVSEY